MIHFNTIFLTKLVLNFFKPVVNYLQQTAASAPQPSGRHKTVFCSWIQPMQCQAHLQNIFTSCTCAMLGLILTGVLQAKMIRLNKRLTSGRVSGSVGNNSHVMTEAEFGLVCVQKHSLYICKNKNYENETDLPSQLNVTLPYLEQNK